MWAIVPVTCFKGGTESSVGGPEPPWLPADTGEGGRKVLDCLRKSRVMVVYPFQSGFLAGRGVETALVSFVAHLFHWYMEAGCLRTYVCAHVFLLLNFLEGFIILSHFSAFI